MVEMTPVYIAIALCFKSLVKLQYTTCEHQE